MHKTKIDENLWSFLSATGPYLPEITIVGGYSIELLAQVTESRFLPSYTEDADAFLNRRKAAVIRSDRNLAQRLSDAGFTARVQAHSDGKVAHETWHKSDSPFFLDFLIQGNRNRTHNVAGVIAMELRFMELAGNERVLVNLTNGREEISAHLCHPFATIYNKLLTFTRRQEEQKKCKDLYYIAFLMDLMAETWGDFKSRVSFVSNQPKEDWQEELASIVARGDESWKKTARKNLESAKKIDVQSILRQDQTQALDETRIERAWSEIGTLLSK